MIYFIGDIHGCYEEYLKTIELIEARDDDPYTVILGDIGFGFDKEFPEVNYNRHKFFAGNHDQYDLMVDHPGNLGRFGNVKLGQYEFFFISGAFSVDKEWRQAYEKKFNKKIWWATEQLSSEEMEVCRHHYEQTKPEAVLSHACPSFCVNYIYSIHDMPFEKPIYDDTSVFLDQLYHIHAPIRWVHGHMHLKYQFTSYDDCWFEGVENIDKQEISYKNFHRYMSWM